MHGSWDLTHQIQATTLAVAFFEDSQNTDIENEFLREVHYTYSPAVWVFSTPAILLALPHNLQYRLEVEANAYTFPFDLRLQTLLTSALRAPNDLCTVYPSLPDKQAGLKAGSYGKGPHQSAERGTKVLGAISFLCGSLDCLAAELFRHEVCDKETHKHGKNPDTGPGLVGVLSPASA
ncbi:hypothetical protein NDU88_005080 [Pleurodeles waltl]|uniref:Uncharacterized protein n=1 Tax=Pleurodeles waltl TaxID=8319 RepID=A0AAV7PFW5_PLEWA|nr:hypothetical protein NDU88_005080 [Pleurodeles waltl]